MNRGISEEDFKYLIDSRNLTKEEKKANSKAIIEARVQRLNERSTGDIKKAKLLQLKLQIEEYLKEAITSDDLTFSGFLKTYIDILYTKRKDFASDVSTDPLVLSQLLNNHREPQEKFMLRLMVHSEKTYENIGEFNQKTWYQIYYKEKIKKVLESENKWRPSIEKQVKNSKVA